MIDLSRAKVNKSIPKNRFKAELSDVASIRWLYKISPDTADFSRIDDEVPEVQVFGVSFKDGTANKKDIATIAKEVPYKILFAVGEKWFIVLEGETLESDKSFVVDDILQIDKRSSKLTDLWEDVAKAFLPIEKRLGESITDTLTRYKALQAIDREIESLQRKVDNEKQTNKRYEYNEQLKRLRAEQEDVK